MATKCGPALATSPPRHQDVLPEMLLEGLDLDGAARLGRHDEEGLLAVIWPDRRARRPPGRCCRERAAASRGRLRRPRSASTSGHKGAAAHAQQHGVGVSLRRDVVGEGGQVGELGAHVRRRAQPAEAALDRFFVLGIRREQGRVALPEALERLRACQPCHLGVAGQPQRLGQERRCRLAAVSAMAARRAPMASTSATIEPENDFTPSPGAHGKPATGRCPARRAPRSAPWPRRGRCRSAALGSPWSRKAVQRGRRHVLTVSGADQRVQVERVGVARVLGPRRRPQQPLRPRALRRQRLPARRRRLFVDLVGQLGVGDGDLAAQRLRARRVGRALGRLLVQQLVAGRCRRARRRSWPRRPCPSNEPPASALRSSRPPGTPRGPPRTAAARR